MPVHYADDGLYPLPLGIQNWFGQTNRLPVFSELTTGGVLLSTIPLVIAATVLQRFWRGVGLALGAAIVCRAVRLVGAAPP